MNMEDRDMERQDLLKEEDDDIQGNRRRGSLAETLSDAVRHEQTGTVWGTIFNILSNVVGGGVLALPFAFANTGFVLGTILLYAVGGLSGYAMWILMTCSHRLHMNNEPDAFSYKAMMIRAYGAKMGKVVEAVIVFYTFGCCVAYASVTGTSLAPLAKDWLDLDGIWQSRITWTSIAGILFAIASSARNLAELKFTSCLAFLTIMYVLFVVVFRLFKPESGRPSVDSSVEAFDWGTDIFKAIPLFSVSFGCHYNIPVFYEDLKDRTPKKMTNIILTSIGIICVTYTIIAYAGYLHFGKDVPSYILQYDGSDDDGSNSSESSSGSSAHQFGADDTIVNVARLGMFMHFAFVYPLICIACRRSVNLFLNRDIEAVPWIQLIFQSTVIVACSVGLAIATDSIGVILDFSGSLFGVFLILTFPGLLLIKLSQDTNLFPEKPNLIISYILVVCGITFTICGTIMTTIGVADGSGT
eukprot:TRINITY_DN17117_c0_g1_i1.p1 TRINITY_DN17117_c0_g1~~TRINITY_DN17117_c0_g1_i1.p1  ORF type:complete len:470 (+),score=49.46 TRINITY_DN17117_c0_g1_i1:52-1461(+)